LKVSPIPQLWHL